MYKTLYYRYLHILFYSTLHYFDKNTCKWPLVCCNFAVVWKTQTYLLTQNTTSMKFKIVKKRNPQNKEVTKFYLQNVKIGMKTTDDICREIANASSLTKGDVLNTFQT